MEATPGEEAEAQNASGSAVALFQGGSRHSGGGLQQVVHRFTVSPGLGHQGAKLLVTTSCPVLEEFLELMSIEAAHGIVQPGLRDRPIDE